MGVGHAGRRRLGPAGAARPGRDRGRGPGAGRPLPHARARASPWAGPARIASAAIDVSDGLLADLGHILEASGVGASSTPRGSAVRRRPRRARCAEAALAGGDDYELLFTAPAGRRAEIAALATAGGADVTRIGVVRPQPGLDVVDAAGQPVASDRAGWTHF